MAFPLLMVLGAALSAKKQQDQQKEFNRQKKIQGETTRMSPWTGMQAAAPIAPNSPVAEMGSGAMSGWAFQQNMDRQDMQDKLFEDYLKRNQSSGAGAWQGVPSYNSSPNLGLKYNF